MFESRGIIMQNWWRGTLAKRSVIVYFLLFFIIILVTTQLNYNNLSTKLAEEAKYTNKLILNQVCDNVDLRLYNVDKLALNLLNSLNTVNFISDGYRSQADRSLGLLALQDEITGLKYLNDDIYSVYIYSDVNKKILTNDMISNTDKFYDTMWLADYQKMGGTFLWMGTRKIDIEAGSKNLITLIRKFSSYDASGAIIINIDESVLHKTISNFDSSADVFILNNNAEVMSHDKKEQLFKRLDDKKYITRVMNEDSGDVRNYEKGVWSTAFFVTSKYLDWKYISILPDSKLKKTIIVIRNSLYLIALMMLLIAVISVLVVNRWTYKPVDNAVKYMLDKLRGSADNSEDDMLEINRLKELFNNMFDEHEKMRVQIKESILAMKWRLISDLLTGNKLLEYSQLNSQLEHLNIHLFEHNHIVAVMDIVENNDKNYYYTSVICMKMEEFINQDYTGAVIEINERRIVAIMSMGDDNQDILLSSSLAIVDLIKEYASRYLNISLTIGCGSVQRYAKDIFKSYHEAIEALKYRTILGEGAVISIDDVKPYNDREIYGVFSYIDIIIMHLTKMDYAEVNSQILLLFNEMQTKTLSTETIRQICIQLIMRGFKVLTDRNIKIDERFNAYESLLNCETLEQFKNAVSDLFSYINEELKNSGNRNINHDRIDKILEYINHNYMSADLSLNKIAGIFKLSTPYLSKLFKDSTDKKFLDYLIYIRIEKAKEILVKSNKSVEEVSVSVGYLTCTSFIRVFKQYTNMTPSEFRKNENLKNVSNVNN